MCVRMYVRMYVQYVHTYVSTYHACAPCIHVHSITYVCMCRYSRYSSGDKPLAVPQMKHSSGVGVIILVFTPLVLGSGVCVPET